MWRRKLAPNGLLGHHSRDVATTSTGRERPTRRRDPTPPGTQALQPNPRLIRAFAETESPRGTSNIFFFFHSPSTTYRPHPQISRHPRAQSQSWQPQRKSPRIAPTPRTPPPPAPSRASPLPVPTP